MPLHRDLRQIIAQALCVPLESVTPDARLYRDLGVSLDFMKIILACEEEFRTSILDEDTVQIAAAGKLEAHIALKTQPKRTY